MKTFITFDGATIAYHDEGEGSPVILLHGYGVDGLGQFGNFERILPLLEKRQTLFIEAFGGAPPVPDPPVDGRGGLIPPLLAAKARVILPDMRWFGASSKPRDAAAYADWAMARDVIALIAHLHLALPLPHKSFRTFVDPSVPARFEPAQEAHDPRMNVAVQFSRNSIPRFDPI